MRLIKGIFFFFLAAVIVLMVVGFALPSNYQVSRSIIINQSPDAVFKKIAVLQEWPRWTAWNSQRFPKMEVSFSGPEMGVGASYFWTGEDSGSGSLVITASDPATGIEYDLDIENGKYVSQGSIKMQQEGDSVRVVWTNAGELGNNPLNRYFGLLMDSFMGPDFAKGLSNLKVLVETEL